MTSQEDLASLWLKAPEGKLCGREEAKAWALQEVWHADDKGAYGMLPFIASKLRKTKDSLPQGDPPGTSALKDQKICPQIPKANEGIPGGSAGILGGS